MAEQQQACPDEVARRAAVLYHNGISGFQGPPDGHRECFVLCWPHPDDARHFETEVLPRVRTATGTVSLTLDDWIGRDYLRLHWTEYAKRFVVLSALLSEGVAFQTQTKGMPSFEPKRDGTVFSQELLEKRVLAQTIELKQLGFYGLLDDAYCEEWNWTTEEGRAAAREFREWKAGRYDVTRENFYAWPDFTTPYDPLTLCSLHGH